MFEIISFAETLPQNIEVANKFIATKSLFGYKLAEIFDFPDFSDIPGGDRVKEETITVDEKIMNTADEYIESIMNRK